MTRGYKKYSRLQGATRGYRGFQGVTEGYKGLQGVTKGLQGVTGGYKGLQGVSRGLQWVTGGYKGLHGFSRKKIEVEPPLDNVTQILARDPNPTSRNTLSTVLLYFEMVGLHWLLERLLLKSRLLLFKQTNKQIITMIMQCNDYYSQSSVISMIW